MVAHLARRRVVRWTLTALGVAAVGYVVQTLIPIVIWRTRWPPAIDALRHFMKKVGNRREVERAGTPGRSTTAVHHIGRTSGREYVTPVFAVRVGEHFYIHLPYTDRTDWCRNVRAAGGCVLVHDGTRLQTTAPHVLPTAEVLPVIPPTTRWMLPVAGAQRVLRLTIASDEVTE